MFERCLVAEHLLRMCSSRRISMLALLAIIQQCGRIHEARRRCAGPTRESTVFNLLPTTLPIESATLFGAAGEHHRASRSIAHVTVRAIKLRRNMSS